MMSVFTIKWHLIFRSLAKESAQFRNTEYLCKIIVQGDTWSNDLPQRWNSLKVLSTFSWRVTYLIYNFTTLSQLVFLVLSESAYLFHIISGFY